MRWRPSLFSLCADTLHETFMPPMCCKAIYAKTHQTSLFNVIYFDQSIWILDNLNISWLHVQRPSHVSTYLWQVLELCVITARRNRFSRVASFWHAYLLESSLFMSRFSDVTPMFMLALVLSLNVFRWSLTCLLFLPLSFQALSWHRSQFTDCRLLERALAVTSNDRNDSSLQSLSSDLARSDGGGIPLVEWEGGGWERTD